MPGNDLTTRVRTVSSVAVAGKEERNNDIWSRWSIESRKSSHPRARTGLTTDSSSGGWRPCFSACPDKILRATGSFFPKNLSWMFCFDNSFFSGISCLRFGSQSHKKKKGVGDGQERTGKGSRCHGCTPLWHRRNIDVAGCVCNRVQCAPAA
jgi:hypothetical protein